MHSYRTACCSECTFRPVFCFQCTNWIAFSTLNRVNAQTEWSLIFLSTRLLVAPNSCCFSRADTTTCCSQRIYTGPLIYSQPYLPVMYCFMQRHVDRFSLLVVTLVLHWQYCTSNHFTGIEGEGSEIDFFLGGGGRAMVIFGNFTMWILFWIYPTNL